MFKLILEDETEIVSFIKEFSRHQIDEELLAEYFYGCKAILKLVDVDMLREGDKYQNSFSLESETIYSQLPFETMPPLLVENCNVMDGNHRLRVVRKWGKKEIRIYDILTPEE